MADEMRLPAITAEEALSRAAAGTLDLIDLRKAKAREADGRALPGVRWIDPFALDHSHALLSETGPVAVFCVHGHEVSRFGCAILRLHGREAFMITGGFEALVAAGATAVPLGREGAQ